jgi:RNA polymerase sigma-70 factor (ECF subfamily)
MSETIRSAQKGDRAALEELVRQHYALVCRFCIRRLGPDLGQDATQETFLTMQKSIGRYAERSSFSTWLLGIAHNHVRAAARKQKLDPAPIQEWVEMRQTDHGQSVIDNEVLSCALKQLSPEHREVVLMHEIEGLKYREIADVLGVPEGTVKSRLHHAFQGLRQTLDGALQ